MCNKGHVLEWTGHILERQGMGAVLIEKAYISKIMAIQRSEQHVKHKAFRV